MYVRLMTFSNTLALIIGITLALVGYVLGNEYLGHVIAHRESLAEARGSTPLSACNVADNADSIVFAGCGGFF